MAIKGKNKDKTAQPERKATALADLLQPAENYIARDSSKVLLIGPQDSMKTYSLNTIPNEWEDWKTGEKRQLEVLYINADNRAVVIDWDKRPHWRIVDMQFTGDEGDAIEAVQRHQDLVRGLHKLGQDDWKPDCIIYDSTSPLSETVEKYVWDNVEGSGDSRDYEGNEERYGKAEKLMNMALRGLMDSAHFFFMISHEKEPYFAEDAAKKTYKPDLIGGIKNKIGRYFQEIYFTVKHKGEWHWQTRNMRQRPARTSYPIQQFLPPDWSIIIERRWKDYYDEKAVYDAEQAVEEQQHKEQLEREKAMSAAESTLNDKDDKATKGGKE